MMWNLPIPRLDPAEEQRIHQSVLNAALCFDQAFLEEQEARTLVEQTIEENA